MNKYHVSYAELMSKAGIVADYIVKMKLPNTRLFGVPRGGVHAAMLVMLALQERQAKFTITDNVMNCDIIIDDLIDSGATCDHFAKLYPDIPFIGLWEKAGNEWVVFPWERTHLPEPEEGLENNITRILQYVGEDATREGLLETPRRVAKAWGHWTGGYNVDISALLKTFEDGSENYDQMVIVKDIPIYSKCEHHLADIFGTATIAYIPNGKVVGLSKLSRLADAFARRLQVQERLTCQIADAIDEHLNPLGVGVLIRARHMCMESRGICQQGHHTITSALRGVLRDDPEARAEFLGLAR